MEKLKQFNKRTLMDHIVKPAELAPIYTKLVAEGASYIIGQFYGASVARGNMGYPIFTITTNIAHRRDKK